jgi:hypothetical protein
VFRGVRGRPLGFCVRSQVHYATAAASQASAGFHHKQLPSVIASSLLYIKHSSAHDEDDLCVCGRVPGRAVPAGSSTDMPIHRLQRILCQRDGRTHGLLQVGLQQRPMPLVSPGLGDASGSWRVHFVKYQEARSCVNPPVGAAAGVSSVPVSLMISRSSS